MELIVSYYFSFLMMPLTYLDFTVDVPWQQWELTHTKLGMSQSHLQWLGCCQLHLHQWLCLNGSVTHVRNFYMSALFCTELPHPGGDVLLIFMCMNIQSGFICCDSDSTFVSLSNIKNQTKLFPFSLSFRIRILYAKLKNNEDMVFYMMVRLSWTLNQLKYS